MTNTIPSGGGIRTSSTTPSAGIIGGYGAGTTTEVSKLFLPMADVTVEGPATGAIGAAQAFTITVGPATATAPFTYTIEATDTNPLIANRQSNAIVATYTWPAAGVKTLVVTVANDLGTVTTTHQITIGGSASGDKKLYLPIVQKR